MNQTRVDLEQANWDTTAAAMPCDYIGDLITVRVTRDWAAECAWYAKYKSNRSKGKKQKLDKTIKEKRGKCVGPDCPLVTEYREKLIKEEFGKR